MLPADATKVFNCDTVLDTNLNGTSDFTSPAPLAASKVIVVGDEILYVPTKPLGGAILLASMFVTDKVSVPLLYVNVESPAKAPLLLNCT